MTATTALTAQNTLGVFDIHNTPPSFVKKQIEACISDIGVDVIKTGIILTCLDVTATDYELRLGMLGASETIKVVVDALKEHNIETTVVDPVSPPAS